MKHNNIKISIIIPSLNVKSFIEECIVSVINQSLKDIEIICIDAGSTDGTLEILKNYSMNDSRISLIHSDKKSYGYQMNLGISKANGEYIGIVESDDFIDEKMYETLYNLTDGGTTDISKVNFFHYYDLDPIYPDFKVDGTKKDLPNNKFTVFENANILNGHPSIWAAIYKKDFLIENNIKFIEAPGGGWVDNPFLFETMLLANSITYKDKPFYYYRELNPNSSTNYMNDLSLPMIRMLDNIEIINKYNCNDENILIALYVRIFWHVNDIFKRDNFEEQKCNVLKVINKVFNCLDENIVREKFNIKDQKVFYKYLSPLIFKDNNKEKLISSQDFENISAENNFLYSYISILENKNKKLVNKNKKILSKNKKLNNKIKLLNKKMNDIKNSKSYKLGSLISYPIRKFKNIKNTSFNFHKNKIKILFMPSDNNRTSGAFLSMANLILNLRELYDLDIFVILPEKGHGIEILNEMDIPYKLIQSKDWVVPLNQEKNEIFYKEVNKKKKINKKAITSISAFIRKHNIDLIHINTTYSYVGAKAAINENIPFVWHLREFLEEDQSNTTWDRDETNHLINLADKIIAISDSIYEKYENTFDQGKLIRVYNGIDEKKFYKSNKTIFNDKSIIFIMVGGFEYYKGQIEFAQACTKLYLNDFKDFEVWFIGTGNPSVQNIVENIFKSSKMNNVRFLGYKHNVEEYYNVADISFTCAKSEAFGRTTVEAMLSGNLVIGANTAGTTELIADKKTGILYESGNAEDLYEKMLFAIKNIEKSKKIAEAGRQFMFENMTAKKNAENIYEIYKDVLKRQ